jgi:putative zinc finger/helix-turn-helix YgiT family protein
MKCYSCGKAEMTERIGHHEYVEARLPYRVILVGIPVAQCPACGEARVTIPNPEGLHEALSLLIVNANRALHPGEIRFVRKYLDKSAEQLAAMMGVDAKTLSRWENGRQKMGPVAERLLRVVVRERLSPKQKDYVGTVLPSLRNDVVEHPEPVRLKAAGQRWSEAA